MSAEFCVDCGRTGLPIEGGLCSECYAKRHRLVRAIDSASVIICPSCGSRMVGSHWERAGAPSLLAPEDLLPLLKPLPEVGIRRVEWEESGLNPLVREMRAVVHARFRGSEMDLTVEFPVRIVHRTCPECSRRAGHYFTSIIQLRGPEGRSMVPDRRGREHMHRLWERELAEARPEWRRALSWEEERPEGWDFYLVDTVAARALARWLRRRLGARLGESPSLYGRKDGRDVYRVTFCLRLPSEAGTVPEGARGAPDHRGPPAGRRTAPLQRQA